MFSRQLGLTLIELVVSIVIISVGLMGILSVLTLTVSQSGDPIVQKQAQALAEGLLEEVQLGLFAYCDGADSEAYYATSAAACASGGDSFGPETTPAESRPYDTVKDYASALNTATSIPATDVSGDIDAPTGYSATVEIRQTPLGGVPAADSLQIIVRVAGPGAITATAEGFRLRTVPR